MMAIRTTLKSVILFPGDSITFDALERKDHLTFEAVNGGLLETELIRERVLQKPTVNS